MAKKVARSKSRLNDIQLLLGGTVPNFTLQKFRRQTAYLALIFLRYLRDVRDYRLDGSELLFVYFGVPEAQRALLGRQHYYQMAKGKWSACCIPTFDLQAFLALSERAQDELTTELLEQALLSAAKQAQADPQPIREAAQKIREAGFTARFVIPGLTCRDEKSGRTANVWSCISRGMIRWQVEITDAQGQIARQEWIPEDQGRHPQFTETTLTPRWNKEGFALCGPNGRALYRLPGG